MYRSANIDPTGVYRYWLARDWLEPQQPSVSSRDRTIGFLMLNPSTADAQVDDPTVRRCISFAKSWGYSRLVVVNLFALRATDPTELARHASPVGPENDSVLRALPETANAVICAWGAHAGAVAQAAATLALLRAQKPPSGWLRHLGLTKDGHPRHPLYLPGELWPEVWEAQETPLEPADPVPEDLGFRGRRVDLEREKREGK